VRGRRRGFHAGLQPRAAHVVAHRRRIQRERPAVRGLQAPVELMRIARAEPRRAVMRQRIARRQPEALQ
jgi:hypothetical protein